MLVTTGRLTLEALWTEYAMTRSVVCRDELVERYMPLVQKVAAVFGARQPAASLDELVCYGGMGLVKAVERFDLARRVKFKSFAEPWIRGAILDGVRADGWFSRSQYAAGFRMGSLDEPVRDASETTLADGLEDASGCFARNLVEKEKLGIILASLDKRERTIILLYYRDGLIMREVGQMLGLSESRICQLLKELTARIREQFEELVFQAA